MKKIKLPEDLKNKESKKSTRELRCKLSDQELLATGRELSEALEAFQQAKEDLKRVQTDYKAKMQAITARVTTLRNKVTTGEEFRMIECKEVLCHPKDTQKTIFRLDTGEKHSVEEMSFDEQQRTLPGVTTEEVETVEAKPKGKRGRKKKDDVKPGEGLVRVADAMGEVEPVEKGTNAVEPS